MCRLLACLSNDATALSRYTLKTPHSLERQAYAPEEMLSGVVNADGFGVGWYADNKADDGEPAVYRSLNPIWSDTTFHGIAPKIRSRAYFAALRNATPPLPSELAAVPPFSSGRNLFMHNGAVDDFRETVMRPMRASLSDKRYRGITGASDSETIFALVLDRLDNESSPKDALLDAVGFIESMCRDYGTKATLNLALTDGEEMVFVRYSTAGATNSLYYLEGEGSALVASERLYDDGRWREVSGGSVVLVGRDRRVSVEAVPF
ncbi:ergothioneine biosynthesis protein EgtC [Rubrobacter indicoceani]|uniref:ergothioneine biosynthesis protein EgtC n=1 Tax=Rubrobacter indicoceani TaxID=2051957 RepID=UPI000E5BFE4A|nr:ergothioneine biosynthesis protein EgtC [Rubrobacter indicoceani]